MSSPAYLSNSEDDSRVQTLKEELKKALEFRFMNKKEEKGSIDIYQNKIIVLSTEVDPRYKLTLFSNEIRELSRKWMLEEICK